MLVQTTRSQIGMFVLFDLSCHLTLYLFAKPTTTRAPLIGDFPSLFFNRFQSTIPLSWKAAYTKSLRGT